MNSSDDDDENDETWESTLNRIWCIGTTYRLLVGPSTSEQLQRMRRRLLKSADEILRAIRKIERDEQRFIAKAKTAALKEKNIVGARRMAHDVIMGRRQHARSMAQRDRFTNLAARLEREINAIGMERGMHQIMQVVGSRLMSMSPEQFEAGMAAFGELDERERMNEAAIERAFANMASTDTSDSLEAIGLDSPEINELLAQIGIQTDATPLPTVATTHGSGGGGGSGGSVISMEQLNAVNDDLTQRLKNLNGK